MACEHKTFRCTNNRFFCLVCGVEIANPYEVDIDKHTGQEEKPVETQKTGRKRKAKKEAEE